MGQLIHEKRPLLGLKTLFLGHSRGVNVVLHKKAPVKGLKIKVEFNRN